MLQAARAAREKGVLFDMAAGRINYDLQVLKQAAAQGFWPDIISTDTVASSVYEHKLFGLPYVMSYALDAGIPLMEVLRACTATPAAQMGLAGTIGTLQPARMRILRFSSWRSIPSHFATRQGTAWKESTCLCLWLPLSRGERCTSGLSLNFGDSPI